MLSLLLLLLGITVYGRTPLPYFQIDTHLVENFGDERILASGTYCKICVKNGLGSETQCRHGHSDGASYWNMHMPSDTSVWKSTYVWTSCDDAMLVDAASLWTHNNERHWGMQNGGAWCLSTDTNDAGGIWADYISAGRCFRTLRFNHWNNRVGGAVTWHPLRRSMEENEGLPTDAEVDACEADPERDCTDLVDQILTFQIQHPEQFIDLPSEVQPLNEDSGARRLLNRIYKL